MNAHGLRLALPLLALLGSACAGTVRPVSPLAAVAPAAPLVIDVSNGTVWVGAHPWTELKPAWSVPDRGAFEVASAAPLASGDGFEVVLVQGDQRWRGELDGRRRPRVALTRVIAVEPPPAAPPLVEAKPPRSPSRAPCPPGRRPRCAASPALTGAVALRRLALTLECFVGDGGAPFLRNVNLRLTYIRLLRDDPGAGRQPTCWARRWGTKTGAAWARRGRTPAGDSSSPRRWTATPMGMRRRSGPSMTCSRRGCRVTSRAGAPTPAGGRTWCSRP